MQISPSDTLIIAGYEQENPVLQFTIYNEASNTPFILKGPFTDRFTVTGPQGTCPNRTIKNDFNRASVPHDDEFTKRY